MTEPQGVLQLIKPDYCCQENNPSEQGQKKPGRTRFVPDEIMEEEQNDHEGKQNQNGYAQ